MSYETSKNTFSKKVSTILVTSLPYIYVQFVFQKSLMYFYTNIHVIHQWKYCICCLGLKSKFFTYLFLYKESLCQQKINQRQRILLQPLFYILEILIISLKNKKQSNSKTKKINLQVVYVVDKEEQEDHNHLNYKIFCIIMH